MHERRWRPIRDRDILDRRVWLRVPIRRLDCHHCDARVTEHIAWLDRRSRMTHRVRIWVEALVQLLPIKHVSQLTGLHWHTIKAIDQQRLEHLNLDDEHAIKLNELLAANAPLSTVYLLKTELKEIWLLNRFGGAATRMAGTERTTCSSREREQHQGVENELEQCPSRHTDRYIPRNYQTKRKVVTQKLDKSTTIAHRKYQSYKIGF
ncbi:transposase family protein [Janthinobacterium sp. LB3P118]|uniref:transposase family protein n=1 Tax=Janthinobacterium sp. LB3P118 TaxID=3424195 RepID=UPI003F2412C6